MGTTFHFARCGSIDFTTHSGHWALASTARQYISQAACDDAALSLPFECRRRACRCAALLSHLTLSAVVVSTKLALSPQVACLSLCFPFSFAVLRCLCLFLFSGLCGPSPFPHFSLLVFPVPESVHGRCGFHDRCLRLVTRMSQSGRILHQTAHMGYIGDWELGWLFLLIGVRGFHARE